MTTTINTTKQQTALSTLQAPLGPGVDMKRVACVVLGGGRGTRLFPLTHTRSKPAIRFGGRYRLIDVPLSNAINAGCQKIFVITQFLSSSLHRHILRTYSAQTSAPGFIELLAVEQKPYGEDNWFKGTADAVRKSLEHIVETPADYFLILSGDQLYNLDFRTMVRFAQQKEAGLVIASLPVNAGIAKRMGLLQVNSSQQVLNFTEKPENPTSLTNFHCPHEILHAMGRTSDQQPFFLGSMGIYLFRRDVLLQLLEDDTREDFGQHLIPTQVEQGNVYAFPYNGYWEDIGTVESFYQANMALTRPEPVFNCYDENNPLYTCKQHLPPPKIFDTHITHSIICEGAIIEASEVKGSILGPRTCIKHGTTVYDSLIMGSDFYTSPIPQSKRLPQQMTIGRDCRICKTIIDTNVQIGDRVQLTNVKQLQTYDGDGVFIRDGITIVTRGAVIPDDFVL